MRVMIVASGTESSVDRYFFLLRLPFFFSFLPFFDFFFSSSHRPVHWLLRQSLQDMVQPVGMCLGFGRSSLVILNGGTL